MNWLNSTWLSLLNNEFREKIKLVKIIYSNQYNSPQYGANGLSCRAFLLGGVEIGWGATYDIPTDGAKLAYFDQGDSANANQKRIAYDRVGNANGWWLRSRYTSNPSIVWLVAAGGYRDDRFCNQMWGIRPAFILPSDLPVEQNADGSYSITDKKPFYLSAGGESVEASPYIQAGSELVACDTTLS